MTLFYFMIQLIIPLITFYLLDQYKEYASKKKLIDTPKENRSMHKSTTPTGAGIVLIFILLVSSTSILYFFYNSYISITLIFGSFVLLIVAFLDDIINLNIQIRVFFYSFSILILFVSNFGINLFNNFSWVYLILFFSAFWFINLYNFMDNCDLNLTINLISFAIVKLICFKLGYLDLDKHNQVLLTIILLVIIPFIFFNKPTAKLFMGDSGSIVFSYIILWILSFDFNKNNYYFFTIFSSYILDATYTLIKRLIEKKNIFKAHKEHLNQIYIENYGIMVYLYKNILIHLTLGVLVIFGLKYSINYVYFFLMTFLTNIVYFKFIINVKRT